MPQVNLDILRAEFQKEQPDLVKIVKIINEDKDLRTEQNLQRILRSVCLNGKTEVLKVLIKSELFRNFNYQILESAYMSANRKELLDVLFELDEVLAQVPAFITQAQEWGNIEFQQYMENEFAPANKAPVVAQQAAPVAKQPTPAAKKPAADKPKEQLDTTIDNLADNFAKFTVDQRAQAKQNILQIFANELAAKPLNINRIRTIYQKFGNFIEENIGHYLNLACRTNNAQVIKLFLNSKAGQAAAPDAFLIACRNNLRIATACLLPINTVKPRAADGFAVAARSNNTELAKFLLRTSKTVRDAAPDLLGNICAQGNHVLAAELLKIDEVAEKAPAAFDQAVNAKNAKLVKLLLDNDDYDDNVKKKLENTIKLAINANQLTTLEFLCSIDEGKEQLCDLCEQYIKTDQLNRLYGIFNSKLLSNMLLPSMMKNACREGKIKLASDLLKHLTPYNYSDAVTEGFKAACFAKQQDSAREFWHMVNDPMANILLAEILNDACNNKDLEAINIIKAIVPPFAFSDLVTDTFVGQCYTNGNPQVLQTLYDSSREIQNFANDMFVQSLQGNYKLLENLLKIDQIKANILVNLQQALRENNNELAKVFFDNLEFKGIKASAMFKLDDPNLINNWQRFVRDPEAYAANPLHQYPLPVKLAVQIINNENRIQQVQAQNRPRGLWGQPGFEGGFGSHDDVREQKTKNQLNNVIIPHYQNQFNAYGNSDEERVVNVERRMRAVILDKMLSDDASTDKTDPKLTPQAKQFILNNRQRLERGDKATLAEARRHFNSGKIKTHVAWRAYDPDAPFTMTYGNSLTAPFHYGVKTSARYWAAYFFLAVIDDNYPETKKDRIANFISEVADIRRCHNFNDNELDYPSCDPGTKTRISNMGHQHPLAEIPTSSIERAKEYLNDIILDAFRNTLLEIDGDYDESEELFEALADLQDKNAAKVVNGDKRYDNDQAQIRLRFIQKNFGNMQQIYTRIDNQLRQGNLDALTATDKAILEAEIYNIAGNGRDAKFGTIWERQMQIVQERLAAAEAQQQQQPAAGFTPFRDATVPVTAAAAANDDFDQTPGSNNFKFN